MLGLSARAAARPATFSCFALTLAAALLSGCGSGMQTASPTLVPATPAGAKAPATVELVLPAPAPVPRDPIIELIANADLHFRAGQRELEQGHVESARQEFDRAVNVLVESPYGGRTEPRLREYFDLLVDRISTYEVKALAEGDGFTEKKSEPALIDELLALSATITPPAPPPAQLQETVQADLQTVEHDIPIPLNDRVLSFIALFQGRLHDFLQEGLQRGSRYLPMVQDVFRAEGLPLDLAYVPLVESAFKTNALSRAKASGMWQFMRATGLENGLRQDWYIDERSDPEKATVAAAKYLSTLAGMFDGDWHMALASYNGGPGRIQRAAKSAKSDDFWVISAKKNLLPRETRDYVPMILAAVVIAKSPEQYGFSLGAEAPLAYDTIALPKPVDLRYIAEWTDTTIDDVQAMNPELRRWTTPIKDTDYKLKVPPGTAPIVTARLEEAGDDDIATLASLKWHTVKRGDTIASVAKKLRVNKADLAEANFLKTTSKLDAGQQLVVPQQATALMAAQADRAVPTEVALVSNTLVASAEKSASADSRDNGDKSKIIYQVKKGDTLSSIARVFSTSVASIKTWNRMPGTDIRVGERLTIYSSER